MKATNLLDNIPQQVPEEIIEVLASNDAVRIEWIVSHGHASPEGYWYDQDEHEFVLLIQGAAHLRFQDDVVEMKTGDWINIPAHQRHRVEWTTPDEQSIWLAVFYSADN